MNKNRMIKGMAYAGIWMLAACSNETTLEPSGNQAGAVQFAATVETPRQVISRAAFDDEKGEVEVLPYVNGISICKIQPSVPQQTVTPYHVQTANKGVLAFAGTPADALKWDRSHLDEPVDFFAWTTPTGVTIPAGAPEGVVDFVAGNAFEADPSDIKDRLNGAGVTPLEVLISAVSTANDYHVSPSVTLPFTHLVSKLSIYLRNWDNQHIDKGGATGVTIEFLSIPTAWKVAQTLDGAGKAPLRVREPASSDDLQLAFTDLHYDAGNGYFTMYLPPLTNDLGTDFATAGDFCITYGGSRYYGTLASIPTSRLTELKAGEHMAIQMDLSKNYGVGVGAYIVEWKGPDKEDIIYANPNRGIYSIEGFSLLADYLLSGDPAKKLPDSLFVEESGQKVIRLYNDLRITSELSARLSAVQLAGLVFDGQGHTVQLPDGTSGLFGQVGAAGSSTEIRNLYLEGGTISARGMLASTASNATILNCHVLQGAVAATAGPAGGLIGEAAEGTRVSYCSSVIGVTSPGAAGGLIGQVAATGATINGCYAQSRVTGNGTQAGGLIGRMEAGTLTNSFFYSDGVKGLLDGTASVRGALVGEMSGGASISRCYWGEVAGLPAVGAGMPPVLDACSAFLPGVNTLLAAVTIGGTSYSTLIEALRAGTLADRNWVWVYGKDYPVAEKK